ncbi:MAG: hypothetical protein JSW61_11140 [Candidatus Thorarchaeota archaeon]|nr:MAG: hypothetical protein JSW61_11140 [Candidatus Thorarchaeota archaeon]
MLSKSKKSTQKAKPKLIRPRGIGLSVKLFKHEGLNLSASQLASLFKKAPYAPAKKSDIASGFSKAKAVGKTVTADFTAGFRVPVLAFGEDVPVHYISVDRGSVVVKLDKGTAEVRGSGRIASRFRRWVQKETRAKMQPLNLNGGTRKVYDTASDIATVLLAGLEGTTSDLSGVEFRGSGIQTADEIALYTRKYKGEIVRFRGTFPYPSGQQLTTSVNALTGSIFIYKWGEGIYEKDLNWIVSLLEDAALSAM